MSTSAQLSDSDFARLLAFRDGLRRFQRWSEQQARAAGITPAQHQLLLAVRGHRGEPSLTEIAGHLLLRHNSVVELVDRAELAGLLRRVTDTNDSRVVRVVLTPTGERHLRDLSLVHLEELSRLRRSFGSLWDRLVVD